MQSSEGVNKSRHPRCLRTGGPRINLKWLAVALTALVLGGCAGINGFEGKYYFDQGDYTRAAAQFNQALQDRPDNAGMNFLMGRSLLAMDKPVEALTYLKKAAASDPHNADHYFWLGVAYWANMDFDLERDSYRTALSIDPEHVQSRVYLGHNLMDRNEWPAALAQYDLALKIKPNLPEALYNRGLALQRLSRSQEEKSAWISYLRLYHNSGAWAARAAEHLNAAGDFSYRVWRMSAVKLSIPAIEFKPGSSVLTPEGADAVAHVRTELAQRRALGLHIIVYVKSNRNLAETRARKIKQAILKESSDIDPARIKISWFDIPEEISLQGTKVKLNNSVKLIAIQKPI